MKTREWMVLIVILLLVVGCNKGKRPKGGKWLDTGHGKIRLINQGCASVDEHRLVTYAQMGLARASSENPKAGGPSLSGMIVVMKPNLPKNNQGEYHVRTDAVFARCGIENVIEHELFHRQCYKLGLPRECCFWVDHRAHPDGRDMNCLPYPAAGM